MIKRFLSFIVARASGAGDARTLAQGVVEPF
jgi:hypothetical protein